jgi:5'-nucleotidase / UDP-sugar diphosphatase
MKIKTSLRWVLLSTLLSVFCVLPPSGQAAVEQTLTVLFTNDTHNRLEPFDHIELKQKVGGVVRRSRYFDSVRANNPQTLILDAGDVFQGTPFYNFYLGEPDITAMNMMGYDAMTMGNHDLDNGILNLKKRTQYAHFPVLCANIKDKNSDLLVFRPFQIFERQGLKIAVMGFMSEHAWQAVALSQKKDLSFHDPIPIAKKIVAELRPKVDLIISLHHMGIWYDEPFAKAVPGVDIVIGGHSHTEMEKAKLIANGSANGIGGTLLMHAGHMGTWVGRLDLTVNHRKEITHYTSERVLMDQRWDGQPLPEMLESYAKRLRKDMEQVVGEASTDFSVAGKYDGPFPLGSLLADILRDSLKTEVGIMNTGGIRNGLNKGPIEVGEIFEILPFDNTATRFELKGDVLRKVVETSASRLKVSKNLQFSGLVYTLEGKKVTQIQVQGQTLDPQRWYSVAAPDYVFQGNEAISFDGARSAQPDPRPLRDMMLDYIRKNSRLSPPLDQRLIQK